MQLSYVNVFVCDMNRAMDFYVGRLGPSLEFASPEHGYASTSPTWKPSMGG
jgi:catechol 2,3-dioxygenase-like lactoylglutathione lyase family enzyme